MENIKIKTTSKNYNLVNGKSVIDHKIRVKLDLSCAEYVAAQFLEKHSEYHNLRKNEELAMIMMHEIGVGLEKFSMIFDTLEIKNIVSTTEVGTIMSSKWSKEFDVSADFEEFWTTIYKKHGNRVEALAKYKEARKIIDKDFLHERARKYIATREQFPEFTKAAQVFLNPKKQHWNDLLPGDNKPDEGKMEGTIFNK